MNNPDQNSDEVTDETNHEGQRKSNTNSDRFAKVHIDRINSKGNLLSFPDDFPHDHIHLSHGQVCKEVIIPRIPLLSDFEEQIQIPVLPFDTVEEAELEFSKGVTLQVNEGELLKLPSPEITSDPNTDLLVSGFNISNIEVEVDAVPVNCQITVRIKDIKDDSAKGRISHTYNKSAKNHSIDDRIAHTRGTTNKSSKNNRGDTVGKPNLFGKSTEKKNDLINGNIR